MNDHRPLAERRTNAAGGGQTTGPPEAEAGGVLTVDLDALAANWRSLRDRAAPAECAAVVKADGYGLGLVPVVRALTKAGCRTFFVAGLSEAVTAREACADARIYVLNGLLPGTAGTYAGLALRPILGSRDEIAEWAAFCRGFGARLAAAIHFDTGMNRLGLPTAQAEAVARDPLLADFEPALVMSHFVSSEEPENPLNARQIACFAAAWKAFPGIPASLCNSSGIFLPGKPHLDLVRPGYALYGGNPTPGRQNPMRGVVRLEGRIVQVRTAEDGETVGYNAQWTARGRRRLAVVSAGYADGYPRAASATDVKRDTQASAGEAIVAGLRCPFAGRVSMDLMAIDVTEVPDGAAERGGLVTLMGGDLTVDEVGRRAGTIGYEVLTSLGRRYARRYVGGEG
ncbi:MAG TPA: alanine racemase [Beijerinckiaceae bacterium]